MTQNHPHSHAMILKDIGYEIPFPALISIMAPKGLPEAVATKLENAFTSAMREPTFIEGMATLNFPILHRSGRELNDYVTRNYEVYKELVNEMARR